MMAKILDWIQFGVISLGYVLVHAVIYILRILVPSLADVLVQTSLKTLAKVTHVTLQEVEGDKENVFTWLMLKSSIYVHYLRIFSKAQEGCCAPDVILYPLQEKAEQQIEPVHISTIQRKDVPLVLVYGSYSCPVFWNNLDEICEIVQTFKTIVDFAIVYVEEAHPVDGWYMSNNRHRLGTPKNLKDRMENAKYVYEKIKDIPVYVDLMCNSASSIYAGFPARFVIIMNGKIEYFDKSHFVFAFKPKQLREWIEKNVVGAKSLIKGSIEGR